MRRDGSQDIERAARSLASRLPAPLAVFAEIAYDYRWCWSPGGDELFRAIDPLRWEACGGNPVRLLQEATADALATAAEDGALAGRAAELLARVRAEESEPDDRFTDERPVAFLCTEFAVHRSLPLYAGGLGVLAGDILKEASDRGLAMCGVGLMYRQGYFHQRLDRSGWQHEYWTDSDPPRLPAALVTGDDGHALTVPVPIAGRTVWAQIWRVNVGRVPLFLLDTDRPENGLVDRWITSRLYVSDRELRLAQYALLGRGAVRALAAMGIAPAIVHLNEGHAALAPLEMAFEQVRAGSSLTEAIERVRDRVAFTTHTPVAAGNEAFRPDEALRILGADSLAGLDPDEVLALGRGPTPSPEEPFGITPLGLRLSGSANGVSRQHGEVARAMWQHLYPGAATNDVPISSVTNGVHLPTWMATPMRELLTRHLGEGWELRAADPATWAAIETVPDEELWEVRGRLRAAMLAAIRERAARDRLGRSEPLGYVESALGAFDPDVLTIGFARRVATYKRLSLLTLDAGRALGLVFSERPVQILIAGKPHPQDDEAKGVIQHLFRMKDAPRIGERVAFVEDYDLAIAQHLVTGCDVWVNVPRPPLEASGTSGMKAALNGALNLSVLDGWWPEAYDGTNGWAIDSPLDVSPEDQDRRDAYRLYDLLEHEVVPAYHDRDERGLPRGWIQRIRASLRSIGPRFCATRMLNDYAAGPYARVLARAGAGPDS